MCCVRFVTEEKIGMRILVAEDERTSRRFLIAALKNNGFEVIAVENGREAWEELHRDGGACLAILDWMMPGMDGVEICREIRREIHTSSKYIILLTSRAAITDVTEGLGAGADDYITKPFHPGELMARVQVGMRTLALQNSLYHHIDELERALAQVRQLQGLLPICAYCKKIRDDQNYWQKVEDYISQHTQAVFSHGICPECYAKIVDKEMKRIEAMETSGSVDPA
jgi:DNA-binding response OmpR family regulator